MLWANFAGPVTYCQHGDSDPRHMGIGSVSALVHVLQVHPCSRMILQVARRTFLAQPIGSGAGGTALADEFDRDVASVLAWKF